MSRLRYWMFITWYKFGCRFFGASSIYAPNDVILAVHFGRDELTLNRSFNEQMEW